MALCIIGIGLGILLSTPEPEPLACSPAQSSWKDPGYAKLAWVDSPNFYHRPEDSVIDTVVLHHTAGPTLEGAVKWFENPESRVSAHFVVGKDGSIVQQVSTFARAWHAGASVFLGKEGVNDFSIGIEMVNLGDGKDPWTTEQVEVVGFLVATMRRRFPTIKYITSHEFVALPKGRKSDPRGFPWERLRGLGLELVHAAGLEPNLESGPGVPGGWLSGHVRPR